MESLTKVSDKRNNLIISVKNLQQSDIDAFLERSTFKLTDDKGKSLVKEITLNTHLGAAPDFENIRETFREKRIIALSSLAKTVEAGYKIIIKPHLGLEGNQGENTNPIITIEITEIVEGTVSPYNALQTSEQTTADLNELMKNKEAFKNEVRDLIKFAALSKKEQKTAKKKLSKLVGEPGVTPFGDCPTCHEREGDLVYDFSCKSLFQVKIVPGETTDHTRYNLVDDLAHVKIKSQQLLRLRVANVNRYLYNVNVTVEDSVYGSSPPAMFNDFFSGNISLVENLSSLSGKKLSEPVGEEDDGVKVKDEFKTDLKNFQTAYNELLDIQTKAYLFCPDKDIDCCSGSKGLEPFSHYAGLLSTVNENIIQAEMINLAGIPSSTEIVGQINVLQKKIDDCNKSIAAARKELEDAETAKDQGKITAAKEKLKKLVEGDCDTVKLAVQLKTLREKLPLRTSLETLKASIPTHTALRRLYLFDRNISRDHYFYRLPPIYPQGDKLKIVLDINAIDTTITREMGFMPAYHDELNLEFSVRQKFLFSFSSGPFIAWGRHLSLPDYGFKQIPASGTVIGPDARYRLDRTGKTAVPLGLAGYANATWKLDRFLGVGGSLGVGYTFNQESILPGIMAGVTATLGDQQRLNFTFGYAGIQVKELKKDLYLGNVYAEAPALEYSKPLRGGCFAGVSYSILKSAGKISIFSGSKKNNK